MMFNNPFLNTIVLVAIAYIIIFCSRISGNCILSKWNSFDFVVMVAFGSILSTILLSTEDSFGTGILGFGLLLLFQYSLTWIMLRSPWVQKVVKAKSARNS